MNCTYNVEDEFWGHGSEKDVKLQGKNMFENSLIFCFNFGQKHNNDKKIHFTKGYFKVYSK